MNKNVDFDLDDPLGDLLSDNSNDSFFNDDKFKSGDKSSPAKTISLSKKKSNLFGLESETTKEDIEQTTKLNKNLSSGDWLGLNNTNTPPVEELETKTTAESNANNTSGKIIKDKGFGTKIQANPTPSKSSFPDSLNFLDDLGLSDTEANVNKGSDKSTKKSSVFDEVLGKSANNQQLKRPETPSSTTMVQLKEKSNMGSSVGYSPSVSSIPNKDNDFKPRPKSDNKLLEPKPKPMKIDSGKDLMKSPKREKTSTKRQRGNADWLGIFPDDDGDVIDVFQDKKEPEKMSDWLMKPEIKLKEKIQAVDSKERQKNLLNVDDNIKQDDQHLSSNEHVKNVSEALGVVPSKPSVIESDMFNVSSNLNLIGGNDIGQQSAAICLQQQESQLMVALQLKAQEERLAALRQRQEETQRVQREVVTAQRQQVDNMLQGQADHRAQLQTVIQQHQQRINKHIQSLLKPTPLPNDADVNPFNEKTINDDDIDDGSEPRFVGSSKIKHTEREQLEQMIANLRENHSKEMDLMETSYRKQIQIVDESLLQIEERLKTENDKMSNYFTKRIEKLEEDNLKVFTQSDERVQALLAKQMADREMMEKKHQSDIAILQEQHRSVILNIRETLLLEQSTIKEATDYSQKLKTIMEDVERNNEICSSFLGKMDSKTSADILQKEQALNVKEDQLHHMLESLERQRTAFESESHDMKLTQKALEDRLRQQTEIIEEDRMNLKKKEIALEMEKSAFQKESEIMNAIMAKEKETINKNLHNTEVSKSEMEKAIADQLKQFETDKQTTASEKMAIENLKSQSQAIKLSLENEMEEVKERKKNILLEQQKLQQNEMKMLSRSQELDLLTRSALAKHANAERRISEAKYAQQRYEDRLKRMQEQAITLNAREQQIARDKVILSRERLTLYNQKKETEWSHCGLCNADKSKYNGTMGNDASGKYQHSEPLEMAVSRDNILSTDNNNRVIVQEIDFIRSGFDGESVEQYDAGGSGMVNEGVLLEQDLSGNDTEALQHLIDGSGENLAPLFHEIVDPKLMLMKFNIHDPTQFG